MYLRWLYFLGIFRVKYVWVKYVCSSDGGGGGGGVRVRTLLILRTSRIFPQD